MLNYTVVKGDTMWMIARKFGVSLEALIKGNPEVKDPNKIKKGDILRIPLEEEDGFWLYRTQSGDTLWAVAKKFGVSAEALAKANPQIENADDLSIGQCLRVPMKGETDADGDLGEECPLGRDDVGGVDHRVQRGDTLSSVADLYRVELAALKNANPEIKSDTDLRQGMMLKVPTGFVRCIGYEVERGDSLWSIAAKYGITAGELLAANPRIDDGDGLFPEQIIWIPLSKEGSGARSYRDILYPEIYRVREGDTLSSVAVLYGTSVERLRYANVSLLGGEGELKEGMQLIVLPRHFSAEF